MTGKCIDEKSWISHKRFNTHLIQHLSDLTFPCLHSCYLLLRIDCMIKLSLCVCKSFQVWFMFCCVSVSWKRYLYHNLPVDAETLHMWWGPVSTCSLWYLSGTSMTIMHTKDEEQGSARRRSWSNNRGCTMRVILFVRFLFVCHPFACSLCICGANMCYLGSKKCHGDIF